MIRLLLVLLYALTFISPTLAQLDLTETHRQPDEFVIDYPADWQLERDPETGFVYLAHDDLQLTLYSPATLAAYDLDNYNPVTLTSLILELNPVTGSALQMLDIGGRETATFSYTNRDTGNAGLLIARPFKDGSIGLIDAYAPEADLTGNIDLILQVAATFDLPPVSAPATLATHAAPWPQTVAELESSGLIPSGGELVFAERYVFVSGTNLTQPLAQALALRDVVLAGTLLYTASATPATELCGLMARRSDDTNQLELGLDSSGNLYLSDTADAFAVLRSDVDSSSAHRLVMLALGERLLVYLDGDLVADTDITEHEGHFGLRVQGDGPGATCEVTDLWVYRVPDTEAGTCDITAANGAVNKRSGPGTAFDIAGILDNGATLAAIASSTGADDLTWWQLRDGAWVREDVVSEQGACRALLSAAS